MSRIYLTILSLCFFSFSYASQPFKSEIFEYTDPVNCTNVHVSLKGENWSARDVTLNDVPFFAQCYANPQIMEKFAGGLVREEKEATEYAATRVGAWVERFTRGQPHGGLLILDLEGKPIGHLVAGGGDEPGASEIARFLLPNLQSKGIGTSLLKTIVQQWAPEVKKVGHDKTYGDIQKRFCCFGNEPLSRLDLTSSPSNPSSWISQDRAGFGPAKSKVVTPKGEYTANFDGQDFTGQGKGKQFDVFEEAILRLFEGDDALKPGQRYLVIDFEGKPRTISKHERYSRIKYHGEYHL